MSCRCVIMTERRGPGYANNTQQRTTITAVVVVAVIVVVVVVVVEGEAGSAGGGGGGVVIPLAVDESNKSLIDFLFIAWKPKV